MEETGVMAEQQQGVPSPVPAPVAEPVVPTTPGAPAEPAPADAPAVPVPQAVPGPPTVPFTAPVPQPVFARAGVSARAGDADRDRVVTLLRDHCVAGRLTLDEFSERTSLALAARTQADLDALLVDLPTASQPPVELPRRRARRWIVAVMGESESKGRWRLGGHTGVLALMGKCHVDLSRAEIDGPEIVITAVGFMGEVEIVVPEGIDVEVTGLSVMGSKTIAVRDVPVLRGSPQILVRAFPIMGEVTVRSRPALPAQLPAQPVQLPAQPPGQLPGPSF